MAKRRTWLAGAVLLAVGIMGLGWWATGRGMGKVTLADPVEVPGASGRMKSSAWTRSLRRAYDAAPPVIPHPSFGVSCMNCHATGGVEVTGVGYAPPSPHGVQTAGALVRCQQCHVFSQESSLFALNDFEGLVQDLRPGRRLYPGAPPVIPHQLLMRENCRACHTGPAAREQIRTSHPERIRCMQCHVPQVTQGDFVAKKEAER